MASKTLTRPSLSRLPLETRFHIYRFIGDGSIEIIHGPSIKPWSWCQYHLRHRNNPLLLVSKGLYNEIAQVVGINATHVFDVRLLSELRVVEGPANRVSGAIRYTPLTSIEEATPLREVFHSLIVPPLDPQPDRIHKLKLLLRISQNHRMNIHRIKSIETLLLQFSNLREVDVACYVMHGGRFHSPQEADLAPCARDYLVYQLRKALKELTYLKAIKIYATQDGQIAYGRTHKGMWVPLAAPMLSSEEYRNVILCSPGIPHWMALENDLHGIRYDI